MTPLQLAEVRSQTEIVQLFENFSFEELSI